MSTPAGTTSHRCPDCGGAGPPDCAELFERLLALDHSRRRPWGPLHAVAVACFLLQHPTDRRAADDDAYRRLLDTFVVGGEQAVHALTRQLVRTNAHRGRGTTSASTDRAPAHATTVSTAVTIADVAVDGTFPASGHYERMTRWAEAALGRGHAGVRR